MSTLINNSIIAAVLGGKPSSKLFDQFMLPDGLIDPKTGVANARIASTPEPATLTVMALAWPPASAAAAAHDLAGVWSR